MKRSSGGIGNGTVASTRRVAGWWTAVPTFLALALAMAPIPALSQQGDASGGFWSQLENNLLVYAQATIPAGELGDHVDLGGGGGLATLLWLSGTPRVALRIEANASGFHSGDNRRSRGGRGSAENSTFAAGIGPQFHLATGSFRPYVFGTWGVAHFNSEYEGWDDDRFEYLFFVDERFRRDGRRYDDDWFEYWLDDDWFEREDEYRDLGFSLAGGAGFTFDVYRGGVPVAMDLSVAYRHHGGIRLAGAGPALDEARLLAMVERYRDEMRMAHDERRRPNPGEDFFGLFARTPAVRATANLVNVRFGVSVGLF